MISRFFNTLVLRIWENIPVRKLEHLPVSNVLVKHGRIPFLGVICLFAVPIASSILYSCSKMSWKDVLKTRVSRPKITYLQDSVSNKVDVPVQLIYF